MTLLDKNILSAWVALCETADQPNLFFLGCAERRITFYSQQVRALQLVQGLSLLGRLKDKPRIAVLGAGAGGVTAAVALCTLGYTVHVYDDAAHPLSVQQGSPRMLHPNIYDWPAVGALDPAANLPLLSWKSDTGANIQTSIAKTVEGLSAGAGARLHLNKGVHIVGLEAKDELWRVKWTKDGEPDERDFDLVIVALGFGPEKMIGASSPAKYWGVSGAAAGGKESGQPSYFLSGNGDGALTDLLALLVDGFEHTAFVTSFLADVRGADLAQAVCTAEQTTAPQGDLWNAYDLYVLPVLRSLGVIADLGKKIRSDRKITFNTSGYLLERGAASSLNQVMAYALLKAATLSAPSQISLVSGHVDDVTQANDGTKRVIGSGGLKAVANVSYKEAWLRHGPDLGGAYSALSAHFSKFQAHHQVYTKANPEYALPPRLRAETFSFFDAPSDLLSEPGKRPALALARELRTRTIVIERDQATNTVVQRGSLTLEELARAVATGAINQSFFIRIEVTPKELGSLAHQIARLARASVGLIVLEAPAPAPAGEWHKEHSASIAICSSGIDKPPYLGLPCPPHELLCEQISACLLRLVSDRLTTKLTTRTCAHFGNIEAALASSTEAIWNAWRSLLLSNPQLREAFFDVISDGPTSAAPWTGDVGSVDQIANAIFLMCAAGIGVASLQPAMAFGTNLEFSPSASAIGSATKRYASKNIDECSDPDLWSVDALILSGATQLEFDDTGFSALLSDAGSLQMSLQSATRVRPALIHGGKAWRAPMQKGLSVWQQAVQKEIDDWKRRQDMLLSKGP